jgi:hypothetical protein
MKGLSRTAKTAVFLSALLLLVCSSAMLAVAQTDNDGSQLRPNQTFGFGKNEIVKFTYTQSFDCVDQPHDDLNFNGKQAESDPWEFQIPICQVGINPSVDPSGLTGNADPTEPLYVLVPMFSVDDDKNPNDAISCKGVVPGTICGPALGSTLIKLFGALPEAFKAKPQVYTQCPDPNLPPGTCTMHASRLDLGPVLVKLGFLPPPVTNVFVPSPNHSHVVLGIDVNIQPIWWQVIPVLVLDQSDWPNQDGSVGITCVDKIKEAEEAGKAIEAPSNFYLFFSSQMAHENRM